jgi:hypothetical protein
MPTDRERLNSIRAIFGLPADGSPVEPEADEQWRQMVSLEFNDKRTICIVYAHPEDGDPFAIGKAYLNDSFQVEFQPPPFPIRLTLPYMLAAARLLQERCHELPVGFSNDKL